MSNAAVQGDALNHIAHRSDVLSPSPVGLLNTYSTRNLGDAAIMSAITRMTPDGVSQTCLDDQLKEQIAISGLRLASNYDACRRFVSVGGDIFNNARPQFVTRNFLANLALLNARAKQTILFGQTVPSSCGWLGLPLLAKTLKRLPAVVVRDCESHAILSRMGINANLSFDAAFTLQPSDRDTAQARKKFAAAGLCPDRTTLLSVRSFDKIYRHDVGKFERRLIELSELLLSRGHQVGLLIQSDVNAADSDLAVARRIKSCVPEVQALDCVNSSEDTNPVGTLMGALSIANIVIAVRYHAAVLRLVGGRQPYNLYYSRKGRDLHNRLGLPGNALEDFDPVSELKAIEASSMGTHERGPQAAHVRQSFANAFGALD